MACNICESEKMVLFESDHIVAFLADRPAARGHIIVTTVTHYPILEHVPDEEVTELFEIVNKLSIVCFEKLKATGTNILINNGIAAGQDVPHMLVHLIPRFEGDGLDYTWEPGKLTPEELDDLENRMKEEPEPAPVVPTVESQEEGSQEDYLLKSLERIP